MTVPLQEARNSLLDRAIAYVRTRLHGEGAEAAEKFLLAYWERVSPQDLVGRDPVDLAGAALSHLHLAERRPPGTAKVRVYTPTFDDHGWASTHSVVEVVVEDMPFLLDSISMELVRQGCGLHLVVHPVIEGDSFIHVEIDRQPAGERMEQLRTDLLAVLEDVRAAVEDWPAMRAQAQSVAADLPRAPAARRRRRGDRGPGLPPLPGRGPLRLPRVPGLRAGPRRRRRERHVSEPVPGSGLGILRDDPDADSSAPSGSFARVPPELRRQSPATEPLILTKAAARATVHRPTSLDYVGVKRYDADGVVVGERRFLGLYTSTMHKTPASEIPVLRRTVADVMERAGFAPASHDAKALAEVIEALPRLELLEVTPAELFETAMGIHALQERQRVRLFARRDRFGRHWSCLVYVPLDRYTQAVRQRITDILLTAFAGTGFEYSAQVGESVLARLHFTVHTASPGPGRSRPTSRWSRPASPKPPGHGPTTSPRRSSRATARSGAWPSCAATEAPSRPPTATTSRPGRRWPTSPTWSRAPRTSPTSR